MKEYNDIADLYREKFSDYTPEPPAEVWERIQLSTSQKKMAVKGKIGIFTAAVAVVVTAAYFLIDTSSVERIRIENQHQEQLVTENIPLETVDIVKEEVASVQNEHSVVVPKKEAATAWVAEPKEIENFATPNVVTSNNHSVVESNNNSVAVSSTQQKVEKEPVAENTKTETVLVKILPVIVSKDTTVCENSTVKLFILNAKNVRWNTGETKNTILVNPLSDEQYSVTFTTESNRDSTVFIHVKSIRCSEMFIPNAFTPNGDGRNDVFSAVSEEEYSFFEMTIYSRDGKQMLFTSKDIKYGWDGTYKGSPQPHGSYRYVIRYKDASGKMNEKTDTFLLLLQYE